MKQNWTFCVNFYTYKLVYFKSVKRKAPYFIDLYENIVINDCYCHLKYHKTES